MPRLFIPTICLSLMALLLPALAHADASHIGEGSLWFVSAESALGPIDGDLYLHVRPRITLLRPTTSPLCDEGQPSCQILLDATVEAPLRVGLQGSDRLRLRERDWSQLRDASRIIRRLQLGNPDDPFSMHLGELGSTTLGHGTIVDGYFNRITTDHHALGFQFHAHQRRWEVQTFTNDVLSPHLLGLHGRARLPVLHEQDSPLQSLQIGATLAADVGAPQRLQEDAAPTDDHWPAVDQRQSTAIAGLEFSHPLLRHRRLAMTTYLDWNHHLDVGRGLHLGLLADIDLSDDIDLSTRLEYRRLSGRYLPEYIDPFYELTRYQFSLQPDAQFRPKLDAADAADDQRRQGARLQLQSRFHGLMSLSASLSDASGFTPANLRLRASFDYDDRSRLGLFYTSQAPGHQSFMSALSDLLTFHDALAVLEGRTQIRGPFYAVGQLGRQWQLQQDNRFDAVWLWHLGVGVGGQF